MYLLDVFFIYYIHIFFILYSWIFQACMTYHVCFGFKNWCNWSFGADHWMLCLFCFQMGLYLMLCFPDGLIWLMFSIYLSNVAWWFFIGAKHLALRKKPFTIGKTLATIRMVLVTSSLLVWVLVLALQPRLQQLQLNFSFVWHSLKVIWHLEIGKLPKGNDRIPSIHFQVKHAKLQGGYKFVCPSFCHETPKTLGFLLARPTTCWKMQIHKLTKPHVMRCDTELPSCRMFNRFGFIVGCVDPNQK